MSNLTFTQKVAKIQKELKAPKSQRNNYGNYNYRNQEDILEAVKPLLGDLVLTVSDEVVAIGSRIYMKATATITDGINTLINTAYAREPEAQKGMSESQLSGTASSYARKYSLNGLFLIDDTKDADTNEFQGSETDKKSVTKVESKVVTQPESKVVEQVATTKTGKSGWGKPKVVVKEVNKSEGDLY